MAKQNVTFVERHLEKFVVGAAGALLLVVVYWFGINTPNTAQVDGSDLEPKPFYDSMREKADTYRNSMRRATPQDDEEAKVAIPDVEKMRSPYTAANLPSEIAAPFASLRPSVPDVEIKIDGDKRKLVDILPPSRPVLQCNRSVCRLPQAQIVHIDGNDATRQTDNDAMEQDCCWVTAWAALQRGAQRELFAKAGYEFERQALVVLQVQAERRELADGGTWTEPEPVAAYREMILEYPKTIELAIGEDGQYSPTQDAQILSNLRAKAEAAQEDILRGRFADFVDRPTLWTMPQRLPEVDLDVNEFFRGDDAGGIAVEASFTREPTNVGEGLLRGREVLKKCDELIASQKFLEAEALLAELIANQYTPSQIATQATAKREEIKPQVEQARQEAERKLQIRQASQDAKMGAFLEPMWITDTAVRGSRTYSYRLRVLAMNPYAGVPKALQDPEQAAQVVLASEWSVWSDPITTPPMRALFLTAARDGDRPVRMELHQWAGGKWSSGSGAFAVGEYLDFGRNSGFEGVLANLQKIPPVSEREVSRQGNIVYKAKDRETAAILLIAADGEVHEHVLANDLQAKRDLTAAIKEEEKAAQEPDTGLGPPPRRPSGPRTPALGGPGRGAPGRGEPGPYAPARSGRGG